MCVCVCFISTCGCVYVCLSVIQVGEQVSDCVCVYVYISLLIMYSITYYSNVVKFSFFSIYSLRDNLFATFSESETIHLLSRQLKGRRLKVITFPSVFYSWRASTRYTQLISVRHLKGYKNLSSLVKFDEYKTICYGNISVIFLFLCLGESRTTGNSSGYDHSAPLTVDSFTIFSFIDHSPDHDLSQLFDYTLRPGGNIIRWYVINEES